MLRDLRQVQPEIFEELNHPKQKAVIKSGLPKTTELELAVAETPTADSSVIDSQDDTNGLLANAANIPDSDWDIGM